MEKVLTIEDLEELKNNPEILKFWSGLVEKGEKIVVSLPEIEKTSITPRSNCQWWQWIWCK